MISLGRWGRGNLPKGVPKQLLMTRPAVERPATWKKIYPKKRVTTKAGDASTHFFRPAGSSSTRPPLVARLSEYIPQTKRTSSQVSEAAEEMYRTTASHAFQNAVVRAADVSALFRGNRFNGNHDAAVFHIHDAAVCRVALQSFQNTQWLRRNRDRTAATIREFSSLTCISSRQQHVRDQL